MICWLRVRAGEPSGTGTSRIPGRVPLSSQKNAKGGGQAAQLACGSDKCRLSSNAFSCELRGSQLPEIRRVRARRLAGAGSWREREDKTYQRWMLESAMEENLLALRKRG